MAGKKTTILEFAEEVIRNNSKPLTAQEIWNKATENQRKELTTKSKDIVQTIYCSIQQNIKKHDDSIFTGIGRNPVRWDIKKEEISNVDDSIDDNIDDSCDIDEQESLDITGFSERDLHKILVSNVGFDPYFSSCYCKTIFHERSPKLSKGKNKWIHPDIVGVSYPFGNTGSYEKDTLEFMKCFEHNECRLFSFEMKINITHSNLREYFFQAVSNSSWAHEGYLVALHYESELDDEMKMLNESFGIGFIELNITNYDKCNIRFPARRKEVLDWNMINKLRENPNFRDFLSTIKSDLSSSSVRNINDFDEQFESPEDLENYIKERGIK